MAVRSRAPNEDARSPDDRDSVGGEAIVTLQRGAVPKMNASRGHPVVPVACHRRFRRGVQVAARYARVYAPVVAKARDEEIRLAACPPTVLYQIPLLLRTPR